MCSYKHARIDFERDEVGMEAGARFAATLQDCDERAAKFREIEGDVLWSGAAKMATQLVLGGREARWLEGGAVTLRVAPVVARIELAERRDEGVIPFDEQVPPLQSSGRPSERTFSNRIRAASESAVELMKVEPEDARADLARRQLQPAQIPHLFRGTRAPPGILIQMTAGAPSRALPDERPWPPRGASCPCGSA